VKKIGLITYHAAHNYGAILQAYATQYTIEKMGAKCEIINFQPDSMKYYNALYKFPKYKDILPSVKSLAACLYRMVKYRSYDKKRRSRGKKFDDFMRTKLKMTREYRTIEELVNENLQYDVTITGSDQTWNIHCPIWKATDKIIDYSAAYFLGFVNHGKKAAFAASIGDTTAEELALYKALLLCYDYIAIRGFLEKKIVESVVNNDIEVVLDPVFLLKKEEWVSSLGMSRKPIVKEPYVLLYSIHGYREIEHLIDESKKFAAQKNLPFVCVTPNAFRRFGGTIQIYDTGPLDFLDLYRNASFVIADTFHAICFSIIFRKPFLTVEKTDNRNDLRKTSLLEIFDMKSRMVDSPGKINTHKNHDMDYGRHEEIIEKSINWSKARLSGILALGNK
jgi:hypothetical protein